MKKRKRNGFQLRQKHFTVKHSILKVREIFFPFFFFWNFENCNVWFGNRTWGTRKALKFWMDISSSTRNLWNKKTFAGDFSFVRFQGFLTLGIKIAAKPHVRDIFVIIDHCYAKRTKTKIRMCISSNVRCMYFEGNIIWPCGILSYTHKYKLNTPNSQIYAHKCITRACWCEVSSKELQGTEEIFCLFAVWVCTVTSALARCRARVCACTKALA